MEKKKNNSKGSEPKSSAPEKLFGSNAVQISEDDVTRLVGGIVEKGISDTQQNKLFDSVGPPKPSVLPFPVARHRSHGPHWESVTSRKGGRYDLEESVEEDENLMEVDSIANFANPIQRKKKNCLEFGRWREVVQGNNHAAANKQEQKVRVLAKKDDGSRYITESIKINEQEMAVDDTSLLDVVTKLHHSTSDKMPCSDSNIFKGEDSSTSLESQIDAENHARIQRMSPDEIAEAQAEIMEKMNPALLKALKRRGQEKLKKGAFEFDDLRKESKSDRNSFLRFKNSISSVKATEAVSKDTSRLQNVTVQSFDSGSSTWNDWNERVEAVRSSRFSLEGNIVENSLFKQPENGDCTVHGYSIENVTSRDFLRTEGDPSGVGYTIKEAVALTRSVIPGQRVIGLHVISSVLGKALLNIHQKKVGSSILKHESSVDYCAIWAFALGPEPELALSLRMCLDDNHNSVVLACAEVIQCILSYDLNETFFDTLEVESQHELFQTSSVTSFLVSVHCFQKTSTYEKDLYTAPVFRSKPEIDVGFLQGGFWKYSAKPSNVLPFSEDIGSDETGEKYTIQDDIVVARQDFVAGLVRMGILPRLRYLLEADPSAALEECILSILVAVARHSPTCAQAIMKCERLIEAIIHRFTINNKIDIHSFKIKSVTLLKVLARSDKKNCLAFVQSGAFQRMTWHLYQYTPSIDHWVNSGKEKCKLSSALIVEQLRLWKVCIQYGYCVSYFSDVFPALCLWLNPPNFGKLMDNDVFCEFATISMEAYHVLAALAGRLPNFFSQKHLGSEMKGLNGNDSEFWSWSCVVPMIDLAVKWIESNSDPFILNFFKSRKEAGSGFVFEGISFAPLLWVYSAVMKMLSQVLGKIIPQDCTSMEGRNQIVPWLPEFVPRVGLEIIKNGFLSFASAYDTKSENHASGASSFIEYLCLSREHGEFELSLASVCCLHGLIQSILNIDRLIQLAKTESLDRPSKDYTVSSEGNILMDGMFRASLMEQRSVLELFTKVIALECDSLQFIETFGRGGPAPGVGIGWGVSGGGYWSPAVLLAQNDAALLISLIEAFQTLSTLDIYNNQELTVQSINSVFAACVLLGPRDTGLLERALKFIIRAPMMHNFNSYIHSFLHHNGRVKQLDWEYDEDDCLILSKILSSHYKDRWLSPKESKSAKNTGNFGGRTFKNGSVSLDTIYEESDETDKAGQDCQGCTSLVVQWAYQRLPFPRHWLFSPISTIRDRKRNRLQKSSDTEKIMQDSSDLLEVAKSGLFFILGVEAFSTFLPNGFPSPIQSVPLIWKLHSLSVILLIGMGVLEDEKSRDIYEVLQDLYGQRLNEARSSRVSEPIPKNDAKYRLPHLETKNTSELLMFQSEIHDSYSAFIETLVDQFSAVSYGDILYGRQIALYLHRCVEAPTRLATWNALTNARVFELLPPLAKCFADVEGYLHPIEDNEAILEAYVKSWVSGTLDRAATRGSMAYLLVLHHLSSYIFHYYSVDNLLLRNKLSRSLLRDTSQKQQRKGMMSDLILYTEPSTSPMNGENDVGSSIEMSTVERRLEVLAEACERNSSLLTVVEELGSSVKHRLSAIRSLP